MAKQPASLTSSTVRKGAGAPAKGAPQRGASTNASKAPSAARADDPLVPLNFRVPASWREEFETYAFMSQPRRKMVDVLKAAFEALKEKEGREV